MSFSTTVKEEISRHIGSARHCQLAELSAMFYFCGNFEQKNGMIDKIFLIFENELSALKGFTLLKKTFNIYSGHEFSDVVEREGSTLKLSYVEDAFSENKSDENTKGKAVTPQIIYDALLSHTTIQKACCRRAFLRGAYLCGGSVSDPEKSYHLEIVCKQQDIADKLIDILATFDIKAKIVERGKYYVVYIKESAAIVTALNVIEAPVAMMEMENAIILKDMRNSINRRNNCDTANIIKTASAAAKQIEDIKIVMASKEYKVLSDSLKELCELRLENSEASLKELGEMLNPPLGKSGVNHRLRKITELAEQIRS